MDTDSLKPPKINCSPDIKYQTASRQFQGIPGIAITPGNRLFATWYSGEVNEGPDNFALFGTKQ